MVRSMLAAALRRLFCSARPAAAQDDGKSGSDEEEGSLPQAVEGNAQARPIPRQFEHQHHNHHNHDHHFHSNDSGNAPAQDMADFGADKENLAPAAADVAGVSAALGQLKLGGSRGGELVRQPLSSVTVEDLAVVREREQNLRFIGEALDMARLALHTNETPVGCVLVHKGRMIAKGMNATNVTRNGTRHAELMALSALLSVTSDTGPRTTSLRPKQLVQGGSSSVDSASTLDDSRCGDAPAPDEGKEDGSKGHLYPYGQKLHAGSPVDRRMLRDSVLYVTVEPCVMCASLLRQFGIKKVYFGAVNDKFGGTGGVFSIHANSLPVGADGSPSASAHPMAPPQRQQSQLPDSSGTLGTSYPPGGGDGGNVEPGYEIEGGWGRDEAVGLLRRFYVQENGRAPVPRKEGRAAHLAAPAVDVGEGSDEAPPPAGPQSPRASAEGGKENTAPAEGDGDRAESSSDDEDDYDDDYDDDMDHEFYLGLAERTRHRGTFAL